MDITETNRRNERADYFRKTVYSVSKEKITQCEYLAKYLKMFGSITPIEALNAFGCFRLGARVSDLRADGFNIITDINKGKNAKRYAIYRWEESNV